ncbi:MAG: SIS domain-containing protein [Elusimicrobia bacterium]|nr:SIS domain-containing protein [Elusimicrobiota bacterium]
MKIRDTLTFRDITEIPCLLEDFSARAVETFRSIPAPADRSVYLAGRGSSGNITLFAKYIWETYAGIIVNFIHPHSIFEAEIPLNFKNKSVWVFSQSGKSPDIVQCAKKLKKWGAKTIAVTNESDIRRNILARLSDNHILLSNSREIPVAATKSYILGLWAALWAAMMWKRCFSEKDFAGTSAMLRTLIDEQILPEDYELVKKLKKASVVGFVGRGPYYAVAEDAALKFREMSRSHALGYSAAEFLHGPIGSYTDKDFVFILNRNKTQVQDMNPVKTSLRRRSTPYIEIHPPAGNFPFNCLFTDVRLKILALKLALEKGLNPDYPEGLKKVTETKF